jgi:molecular chaperone IbpA
MTPIGTIRTLDSNPNFNFRDLNRFSVGFDKILDHMMSRVDSSNYPPYNIIRVSDDSYKIELALAGFRENEINVTVRDSVLTVTAEKSSSEESVDYLYKGIGYRSFSRPFNLTDYVEVVEAKFSNGILTIVLERHVPESSKPRQIPVKIEN